MNVFELFAVLGLDTSQYDEGLKGAESSANSFGATLSQGLGVAASVGAAAVTATTTAVVAGSAAFVKGVNDVASYGDMVDKTSQKLGLSTQSFQEWDYVLNIAGTSMQNVQMGLKTLTNQIDEAKNGSADAQAKFAALGISMEDLETMSREEIFEAAIYGFQGMAESTERAALANDLFGRSGQELAPLFNMTQEQTQGLIETANEYGMVMSEDAVAASATFKDSLTTLQGTMNGLKNSMLSEFLPSLSTVMDGLSAVFAGDDSGLALIEEGVNELADSISEVAPRFIQIGGTILTALASSITENLPVLLTSGAQAVSQIATGIIMELPAIIPAVLSVVEIIGGTLLDNASEILNAGLQIVLLLADGLTQSLPSMVPAIASVVTEIVTTLTEPAMLSTLISAGLQLILALGEGLIQAMPEITGLIPVYYVNIITTMVDMFPEILESAVMLIGQLGVAVVAAIGGLMGMSYDEVVSSLALTFTAADNFGNDVINWFTNIFQTDFLGNVGTFFLDLYGNFTGGFDAVFGAVTGFGSDVMSTFTGTFDNVQETVSSAIDSLLDMFDFEWSLPEIKLPHFSVSGGEAPWGFGGQGSLPTVSIQWYKKAMNTPYLLDSATIFGAANGQYLGGGEAGTEMIYSHDKLMDDIGSAIDSRLSKLQIIAPIYIGGEKIDEVVVKSEQRNNYISGGR